MEWWEIVAGVINAVILGMTGLLARSQRRMRTNDLEHLQQSLNRIEEKLDAHIQYHLERGL